MKKFFTIAILIFFAELSAQKVHTVSQGDTAYSISKKYGLSFDEFVKLNPSIKEGKINIGDVLTIQKNSKTEQKTTTSPINNALGTILIQPKQTIYGLTKRFKISEAELNKLNPDLAIDGLKIGSTLSLPLDKIKKFALPEETIVPVKVENTPPPVQTVNPKDEFVNYTVESGDTIFSLTNKFGSTIDQLIAWNPALANGLKVGMDIKVKKIDVAYKKKSGETLGVVLMLPFGYDTGDSKYRNMSLEFLTGAKLAFERNAKDGKKMDVVVVDAGNEKSFKNSLTQINVNNTDLIIGPFFKSSVLEALNYIGDKKIPIVSPFANSEDLYPYNNLILVEPNDKVYADKINEEIIKVYANQKIYLLTGADAGKAQYLKAQLEKNIKNSSVIIVKSASEIQTDKNMMTGQPAPVIAVLCDEQPSLATDFSNQMIQISKETTDNKAFSMYFSTNFEKNADALRQVNLVYFIDRKINTDGDFEKEVLRDYKAKYCTTPSKYAIIGFDVVNDMLSRENKDGEIFKQINKVQTQLATKFEFVKAQNNGAYINTGFRVVRLLP